MELKETKEKKSTVSTTKQTCITSEKKSVKFPVMGALWIFNPLGSTYKDPDTKEVVVRTEPTLQYSKSGVPQKYALGKQDMENFKTFFESKEWSEISQVLPDIATLEPKTV